jgi:NAD(P)-dependent dehydrogenase (short-subunit alcohol dehydrogenase family)
LFSTAPSIASGSRGIGAAIAKRLAADGANVAITYAKGASAASTANFAGFFFVPARCAVNPAKLSNGMAQIPILKTANVLRTLSGLPSRIFAS